jgi:hypothetical protein
VKYKCRLLVFLIFLLSCKQNVNQKSKPHKAIKNIPQQGIAIGKSDSQRKFLNVFEVVSDTMPTRWGNYTGDYTSVLHFNIDQKDTVWIEYYGQCWYAYPYIIKGDRIIIYWDDNMDCIFDMGFKKIMAGITSPVLKKPFVYLTLHNDTLFADYTYKEWVKALNQKDSELTIFPNYFIAGSPK